MNRPFVLVTCTFSLGVLCGHGDEAPPPDSCESPTARSITELEIGPEMNEMHGFEPWTTDDYGYITRGFQGGNMLGVSLRLSGDAPACLQQKTVVKSGGKVLAQQTSPLNTYDAFDGTRTTRTMWLVFENDGPPLDSQVQVIATAGGKTTASYVTIAEDRHRLESLTVRNPSTTLGYQAELEVKSRHAPQYSGFMPTISFSTPGILATPSPMSIYDDVQTILFTTLATGETDVILTFRDQELRAHVVVTP